MEGIIVVETRVDEACGVDDVSRLKKSLRIPGASVVRRKAQA